MPETPPETTAPPAPPAPPAPAAEAGPGAGPGKPTETPAKASEPVGSTPPSEPPKKVVPEQYDLKLPKDSPFGVSLVERTAAYAKERGLSQEEAQTTLNRDTETLAAYVDEQRALLRAKSDEWIQEFKADKEFGGEAFNRNAELAKRFVARFGDESIKGDLDTTGLGNHPGLVRMLTRAAQSMSEDQLVLAGTPPATQKSAEEIFYGAPKQQ